MNTAPYELTKMDISALKQADYIVAWLDRNGVIGPKFQAVKRAVKSDSNPFATDMVHEIAAPIRSKGYWYVIQFHSFQPARKPVR